MERTRLRSLAVLAVTALIGSIAASAQSPASRAGRATTVFDNARLIFGDARPAVDVGTLVVADGKIVAAGPKAAVTAPARSTHVDLTGKTIMPAWVNVHVHIGYEAYTSWGPQNYTPQNVLDHLRREAFYGVAATMSVGSSPTDASIAFESDQTAGKFPPASRFLFMPGMAPPGGGPDAVLIKGTTALHAIYEVSTPSEARAAVRTMADRKLHHVKIWVDDRRGTYPKMTPDVYTAVIDEAHRRGMVVHAHATTLADQKAVVRAGIDVLVHTVQNQKVDAEFLDLLREKRPYWTTVIGLGDRTEVCNGDPFVDQVLPSAVVAAIRATKEARPLAPSCGPPSSTATAREENLTYNFSKMIASGARLVLGTDAGISSGYSFGSADHHEVARWVQFGLKPAEAIVAATSRPAELLGLRDLGTLAPGKSADFVVLTANPLDDIRNTRKIADVYLHGTKLDRDGLLATWRSRAAASPLP